MRILCGEIVIGNGFENPSQSNKSFVENELSYSNVKHVKHIIIFVTINIIARISTFNGVRCV